MDTIKLGDRKIPMLLTSAELVDIQEEIGCTVAQLRDEVFGFEEVLDAGPDDPKFRFTIVNEPKKLKKLATLIRILGNAGLEESGEEPDLTDKWVLRNMKPNPQMTLAYAITLMAVVNGAMAMENEEKKDGPVDVILEEENRKKEPGK